MKKFVALLFCIFLSTFLYADWNLGLDLRGIDCLWSDSMRFDFESGFSFGDVRISLQGGYAKSRKDELDYIEGGASLAFYPFDDYGFYVGCTLIKLGYLFGLGAPEDSYLISSDANIGWTIEFPYCYIEPRFSFLDVFSSENSTLAELRESISQYSPFRLSLLVGVWI